MVAMNAHLENFRYDRPLLKIIHFSTTVMEGNFKRLWVLSLLLKNSRLINTTVTEVQKQRMNRPASQRSSLVHIRNTKHQNGPST